MLALVNSMHKKTKANFLLFLLLVALFIILLVLIFLKTSNSSTSKNTLACKANDLSGQFISGERLAIFEGRQIPHNFAYNQSEADIPLVLSVATFSEKWIEVDLSEQRLKAWEGENLFLETPVSTGLPWWPTPKGEYRIWIKLRYTKMEGGEGKYYYYLPNVPYVMFFEGSGVPAWKGYGLHGTYWHNDFGTPRSHGCVNLPTSIAERLFYWTTPTLPEGKWSVRSSDDNPGTRIVIHD